MRVVCESAVQFMNVVETSVHKGLLFEANFSSLTIVYDGGF